MSLNEEVNKAPEEDITEEHLSLITDPLVVFRNKPRKLQERESDNKKHFDLTSRMFESCDVAVNITVNLENPLRLGNALCQVYLFFPSFG